ncbi:TrmH family RNA methyltransferase [Aquimarina sp. AU474]|uniref:TrmH family RNA methyltransferase n=1 Tax=Aquimarina sp. AU474 TaxID=2108529 RepID=UPI000D69AA51|nr:TrmH family RNA methyltransferase [Aquimarina sp. AU474]
MSEQLHHHNTSFNTKQFPITLICDRVNSPANIGSIFRIADSFGIEQIYFCGEDISIISKRMQRTARSTHEFVPFTQSEDITDVINQLKKEQYFIISLEITTNSIPISEYQLASPKKVALIIGEESFGVSDEALALSDQNLHINMYGKNSSMNVATATGVALYEMTKQLSNT